jgi:DNA-binding CsgD family transcriptional regulator
MVTVTDPERGLTPAEAGLTTALARDQTLREYADTAGITTNTARWTLKQVLNKTGCRRQTELVALVLAHAAELGPAARPV